jgi:hypothetical protein
VPHVRCNRDRLTSAFWLTTARRGHTLAHNISEDWIVLGLNADGVAKTTTGGPFRHSRPAYPSWERAAQALSARKLSQLIGTVDSI